MSFALKLDIKAENALGTASLTTKVLEKITLVNQSLKDIERIEFQLFDEAGTLNKKAIFRMTIPGNNIFETSEARNWEDAIENVFEKISENHMMAY